MKVLQTIIVKCVAERKIMRFFMDDGMFKMALISVHKFQKSDTNFRSK